MNNLSQKAMKRGITLFGGNFVLPFENQIHLSNSLSIQYLQFCQNYNTTFKNQDTKEKSKKQSISSINTKINDQGIQQNEKSKSKFYEYLVLAPRKIENNQQNLREFYDIGTIVNLEQCIETGAIKGISSGVDSLVKIKKNNQSKVNQFETQYTEDNRLIVQNDPTLNSFIKTNDLSYVIKNQRKLFFCDYETLHEKIPKYSDKEKERFIRNIYDLAQRTQYQNLIQKDFLENLAADKKNSMFPRVQLFQILKHLDNKYYYNRSCSEWLDQKYEILKTKNDEQILQTLKFVSNKLNI